MEKMSSLLGWNNADDDGAKKPESKPKEIVFGDRRTPDLHGPLSSTKHSQAPKFKLVERWREDGTKVMKAEISRLSRR